MAINLLILSDSFNGYGAEHMLRWLGNYISKLEINIAFYSIFDNTRNKDLALDAEYFQMKLPDRIYDYRYVSSHFGPYFRG